MAKHKTFYFEVSRGIAVEKFHSAPKMFFARAAIEKMKLLQSESKSAINFSVGFIFFLNVKHF